MNEKVFKHTKFTDGHRLIHHEMYGQLWLAPVALRTPAGRLTSEQIKEHIAQSKRNLANKDVKKWEHPPIDEGVLLAPGSLLSGFKLDEVPTRALLHGKGYDNPPQDKPAACVALENVK
jgi:hypothetical protein